MPALAPAPRAEIGPAAWWPRWNGISVNCIPLVGFIVTSISSAAERVTLFYNQRGKAEQYIKEGMNAIKWTRLLCRKFRDNAVP